MSSGKATTCTLRFPWVVAEGKTRTQSPAFSGGRLRRRRRAEAGIRIGVCGDHRNRIALLITPPESAATVEDFDGEGHLQRGKLHGITGFVIPDSLLQKRRENARPLHPEAR